MGFIEFVRSVFSDNGTGSFSRVTSFLVVASVLGWITRVVFKTNAIPDLSGAAMFLTTGVGVLYGTNKLPAIIDAVKGKDSVTTQ